jgi:hypothetical protein
MPKEPPVMSTAQIVNQRGIIMGQPLDLTLHNMLSHCELVFRWGFYISSFVKILLKERF